MTTIRVVFARGHVLVTEFRGMALNGIFCAAVLRPLDLVPLTDFTYKYHPAPTMKELFWHIGAILVRCLSLCHQQLI